MIDIKTNEIIEEEVVNEEIIDDENIEDKTTNFTIAQIRGKHNNNVDKEVVEFVEENIWRFREARDGKQELSIAI